MPTDNAKSIGDLIGQLNVGNSQMRRAAARELVKVGTAAVEPLISHLKNANSGGRE